MALTLEAEQRLIDVGLDEFYSDAHESWLNTVQQTKSFVANNFPEGAAIRRDDVAKALYPILEVHEGFKDYRSQQKLRGKFWIKDFGDFVIDRLWDQL
jgi:hypothetical protein